MNRRVHVPRLYYHARYLILRLAWLSSARSQAAKRVILLKFRCRLDLLFTASY